jgi:hypothetical protein
MNELKEEWLNVREAAEELKVCTKTLLKNTVPKGPIPALRFGRTLRYSRLQLRALGGGLKPSAA